MVEGEDTLRKLTKYCPYSDYGYEGFTDELASLLAEDDAAAVNWGGQWKTPSEDDYMELIENCTITTDTINNVVGLTFKAENGNSIFMPAVRYYSDEGLADYVCGRYWTSTLATDISYTDPICAMNCTFYLENEYADVYPWVRKYKVQRLKFKWFNVYVFECHLSCRIYISDTLDCPHTRPLHACHWQL